MMEKTEEDRLIKAVIFDLDGVIVSTDELHFRGWKTIADRENIPFSRADNERLRGVSRLESLEILLEKRTREYSEAEKQKLAADKNQIYMELLDELTPADMLPGVSESLVWLKEQKIQIAIGSSSRNTPKILQQIGLAGTFDAVADGNQITRSKPDPEVFLLAASLLGRSPAECLVVEDAEAGIEAARAGGMKALGVGAAANCEKADYRSQSLVSLSWRRLLEG